VKFEIGSLVLSRLSCLKCESLIAPRFCYHL